MIFGHRFSRSRYFVAARFWVRVIFMLRDCRRRDFLPQLIQARRDFGTAIFSAASFLVREIFAARFSVRVLFPGVLFTYSICSLWLGQLTSRVDLLECFTSFQNWRKKQSIDHWSSKKGKNWPAIAEHTWTAAAVAQPGSSSPAQSWYPAVPRALPCCSWPGRPGPSSSVIFDNSRGCTLSSSYPCLIHHNSRNRAAKKKSFNTGLLSIDWTFDEVSSWN